MGDEVPGDRVAGGRASRGRATRRRTLLIVTAAVVVVALVAASIVVVFALTRATPGPAPHRAAAIGPTVAVARQNLQQTAQLTGTLGYGPGVPITPKATGTITWLPPVGQSLGRGSTLLRVDDRPVPVFLGDIPLFRPLDASGTRGPDVTMVADNLIALGFLKKGDPDPVATGPALHLAVMAWQKSLDLPSTGVISPGDVTVLAGPGRVASVSAHVGDASGTAALTVSSIAKSVAVSVSAAQAGTLRTGAAVTVTLPSGASIPGSIASIGSAAADPGAGSSSDPGSGGGAAQLQVVVALSTQKTVAALDSSSVTVTIVTATHANVLTVPIAALLALREGGYALQKPDGSLIPAKTGMFAADTVEVSGAGITPGLRVVVAR